MKRGLSRFLLAGGQNAVPASGWFLGGWTPGTTLVLFWFENLIASLFIASRIAMHWRATRTRGHTNGYLRNFLLTALVFTLAHGLFLAMILGSLVPGTVQRQDVITGLQWMGATQLASLAFDAWTIGRWPFAEMRARSDWLLGRVVMVHISILFGMFAFASMGQPWWFFSVFIVLKAMSDFGSILPQWKPKEPPAWLTRTMDRIGKDPKAGGPKNESFADYWKRTTKNEAQSRARDEEVVPVA